MEFGEIGDGVMKSNVAASGRGRVNVVRFLVFVRCMVSGFWEMVAGVRASAELR